MARHRLRPLSKQQEMRSIAAALQGPGALEFISYLRAHPRAARELGRHVERARKNFAAAFPGQTRDRVIANADWDKAGYGFVAAINEAMFLKGA